MLQSRPFLHKLQKEMINGWYHMINYNGMMEKWKNEGYTANLHITFDTFVIYSMIRILFNPCKYLIHLKGNQFKYYKYLNFPWSITEKIKNICSEYFLWCGTTALPLAVIGSNHSVEAMAKKNNIITSEKRLNQKKIKGTFIKIDYLKVR